MTPTKSRTATARQADPLIVAGREGHQRSDWLPASGPKWLTSLHDAHVGAVREFADAVAHAEEIDQQTLELERAYRRAVHDAIASDQTAPNREHDESPAKSPPTLLPKTWLPPANGWHGFRPMRSSSCAPTARTRSWPTSRASARSLSGPCGPDPKGNTAKVTSALREQLAKLEQSTHPADAAAVVDVSDLVIPTQERQQEAANV